LAKTIILGSISIRSQPRLFISWYSPEPKDRIATYPLREDWKGPGKAVIHPLALSRAPFLYYSVGHKADASSDTTQISQFGGLVKSNGLWWDPGPRQCYTHDILCGHVPPEALETTTSVPSVVKPFWERHLVLTAPSAGPVDGSSIASRVYWHPILPRSVAKECCQLQVKLSSL
jgi:hypothetical protein